MSFPSVSNRPKSCSRWAASVRYGMIRLLCDRHGGRRKCYRTQNRLIAIKDSPMAKTCLYSIGHSNHDVVRLIQLLQAARVTAVADVRSQPYSQRLSHFNRSELARHLQDYEIDYAFLGD